MKLLTEYCIRERELSADFYVLIWTVTNHDTSLWLLIVLHLVETVNKNYTLHSYITESKTNIFSQTVKGLLNYQKEHWVSVAFTEWY